MPFDEEEMKIVQAQRQEATLHAKNCGVIIGETHDNPHGRGLVCNLIQDGAIDTLFLEVAEASLQDMIISPLLPEDPCYGKKLGQWLREISQSQDRDLTHQPHWAEIKATLQSICRAENRSQNPAKTTRVIEMAVLMSAQIYLVDYDPGIYPGGDWTKPPVYFKRVGHEATTVKGMRLRDQHIAAKVMEVSQGRGGSHAGMALLCGSDHGIDGRLFDGLRMGRVDVIKAKK